ncbi:MATE family efflux transporter [Halomicrobium katesii]|uniref:MATE family efflux transporter n=1 Tax=Halomicrobium katesii TaxID=437163 RepID=UPI000374B273|nr:MATE family efflux transporter [Halomicrobium katesii]
MTLWGRLRALFDGPTDDLTTGGIARPLLWLAIPIAVTNALQTAYNLTDTLWIGRYSTTSLAAMSFAFPMVYLLLSLGLGVSVAGSVLVAQHTGAEDTEEANFVASQTITYATIASVVLGATGYLFVDDLLAVLGASGAVLTEATAYLRIISLGIGFFFTFVVFISLLRGYGDTVTPMLVMFGSVVLNVALDPILIYGWGPVPELGIRGAAFATVACRGLAAAFGVGLLLYGTQGLQIRPAKMIPDIEFGKKIGRVGLPSAVEEGARALAINLMLFIVGLFPTAVVAGYGVGIRVFSLVVLPAVAFASGVETMVGQNIGAREHDRAERTVSFAAVALLGVLTFVGLVVWVGAPAIVDVFTRDPDVVAAGATFLRFVAPTFGFIGVRRAFNAGFRGAGKTGTAAIIVVGVLGVVRLSTAYGAADILGPTGIWLGFALSNVVGGLLAFAWYSRGTWRGTDLMGDAGPEPADDD